MINNENHFNKIQYFKENSDLGGILNKSDNKSHSNKAKQQANKRNQKLAEQVSKLPNKMQQKLVGDMPMPPTTPSFTKNKKHEKMFTKNKESQSQSSILKLLDEDLQVESDLYWEEYDNLKKNNQTQTQTQNQYFWDVAMTPFDMRCIQNQVDEYVNVPVPVPVISDLWKKFGLAQTDYNEQYEYDRIVLALETYMSDPEYYDPEYQEELLSALRNFENKFEMNRKKQEEKDDDNDWWKTYKEDPVDEEVEDEVIEEDQNQDEDLQVLEDKNDQELQDEISDWLEISREKRFALGRDDLRDDLRDDDV